MATRKKVGMVVLDPFLACDDPPCHFFVRDVENLEFGMSIGGRLQLEPLLGVIQGLRGPGQYN